MSTPTGAPEPRSQSAQANRNPELSAEPVLQPGPFALGRAFFSVRVTAATREYGSAPSGLSPLDFWFNSFEPPKGLSKVDSVPATVFVDAAERQLANEFPLHLLDEARRFRGTRSWATKAPTVEPAFSFRVSNIRYGSLFFEVSVSSVSALVKYLHDDPELVLAFLDLCVPRAFEDTFQFNLPGRPVIDTAPDAAFERALTEAEARPSDKGGPSGKTTWGDVFQRASQIAWLLPTVLALVVLYVGAGLLSAERDRIHAREAALDGIGQQLRSSDENRITKLEALTLSLVQQVRSVKEDPKVTPCCHACCSVPQCPLQPPQAMPNRSRCGKYK